MELQFQVPGMPVGKARPRVTRQGHAYTPEKTAEYEELVRLRYAAEHRFFCFETEPLRLTVIARYPIPKRATKKDAEAMAAGRILPAKKPDADNIVKIIADALNGLAYTDDRQIVQIYFAKYYAPDYPYVSVKIEDVEGCSC